jgi:hypothetical protein
MQMKRRGMIRKKLSGVDTSADNDDEPRNKKRGTLMLDSF